MTLDALIELPARQIGKVDTADTVNFSREGSHDPRGEVFEDESSLLGMESIGDDESGASVAEVAAAYEAAAWLGREVERRLVLSGAIHPGDVSLNTLAECAAILALGSGGGPKIGKKLRVIEERIFPTPFAYPTLEQLLVEARCDRAAGKSVEGFAIALGAIGVEPSAEVIAVVTGDRVSQKEAAVELARHVFERPHLTAANFDTAYSQRSANGLRSAWDEASLRAFANGITGIMGATGTALSCPSDSREIRKAELLAAVYMMRAAAGETLDGVKKLVRDDILSHGQRIAMAFEVFTTIGARGRAKMIAILPELGALPADSFEVCPFEASTDQKTWDTYYRKEFRRLLQEAGIGLSAAQLLGILDREMAELRKTEG